MALGTSGAGAKTTVEAPPAEGENGSGDAGQAPAISAEPLWPEAVEAESAPAEEPALVAPWYRDRPTAVILGLIALQFLLTLYLGGLATWWSVTGFLWLLVGYGVVERLAWALVLPLVLFALDMALLLFGAGPRQRAGFYVPVPLDFVLYLLRVVIWGLIFRLREEMD